MEATFRQGDFERGALEGIRQIRDLLVQNLPPSGENPDELANGPVIVS